MAPIDSGICELDGWEVDTTCLDIPADTPPETLERWRKVAAEFLYIRTGSRLGPSCPVTVRPCRRQCADSYGWLFNQGQFLGAGFRFTGGFIPYMAGGSMFNASLCGCSGDCHCGPELCEVYLPGPVYDVQSVTIDGTVVPDTQYSILDGRYLVRHSNVPEDEPTGRCWPSCQDMSLPSGEGTFVVTYRTGLRVPAMGAAAVTKLVEHYIRGCNGCGCGVAPRNNLSRLSRQGVDLEFQQAGPETPGWTGIELVDQFIHAYNPSGLPRQLRVLSPDAPKRPRTWQSGVNL